MSRRAVVWAAALAAALLRYPGLMWPLRPDEAGFLLVARTWHPEPDSLYGTYWVDRPPPIIALVKASDWLGGPYFLRVIAALGCIGLVLLAAAVARRIGGERAAPWTAVATAALVSTSSIDPIAAKGEVLGIPLVMLSIWLALKALDRDRALLALGSGAAATLALGLKQNLVGGLVFGAVLLIGSLVARRIDLRTFGRMTAAALVGAGVPLLATVAWTLLAGVHLETLWYAVFGMRSDALTVLESASTAAPDARRVDLLHISLWTGLAVVLAWLLICADLVWRRDRVIFLATLAMLAVDLAGVVLGGSFWRPYLLNLVPAAALTVALTSGLDGLRGRLMRVLAIYVAGSAVVSSVTWLALNLRGGDVPDQVYAGEAIGAASQPGDTLVIFGGRADLQYASGLPSPYEHLWSLPMRTLDPELTGLNGLLTGPDAPTWFVAAVDLDSWDMQGHEELEQILEREYVEVGDLCGLPVWLHKGEQRPEPVTDCDRRYW